ncbi:hypothetical protein [Terriglobus roseus]|uniref:DUF308 domain-containing protein n=1 Tax=Terriglobus roseus TaxID=392734 RepID=A0A1G7QMU5_9BACT|nr:hypothetical protein [Terriglobus roseus]SDF99808.1 hypothetical protein SAMN05444167_3928 [Terriglobus roseus]
MQSRTSTLRNLYFARTFVQIVWAVLVIKGAFCPGVTAALLVLYPLWDVACTLFDLQSASEGRMILQANVALGVLTAISIGVTNGSHPTYAIASFGVWALAAGLLQLAVGLARRKQLGGQWAMILSGAQSTAAGVAFTLGGLSGKLHAKDLGGYAVFGAVYFLITALLLQRKLHQQPVESV